MWVEDGENVRILKKNFSRSISKKLNFGVKNDVKRSKSNCKGETYFSLFKKTQNFPKDLLCFLSKNLKIAKKKNLIFKIWDQKLKKKRFFLSFLILWC
jgi:hypothetical protein